MRNFVWIVSYPKSGNTWFRIFLTNYLKNGEIPSTLEEIESTPLSSDASLFENISGLNPFELSPDEVDLYRPDIYRYESKESEKTCYRKTHDAYTLNAKGEPIFPAEISKGAIYVLRNPLDVCVSYANHGKMKIKKTINFLLNEKAEMAGKKSGQLRQTLLSWKGHIARWRNQQAIPIHFVRYEDMKLDPIKAFGECVRFLELEYDEKRLRRAIEYSDFEVLKEMEMTNGFNERLQNCNSFFWKGKIGNYRDHLSDEEIKQIVECNYDMMKAFGYIDQENILLV